MWSQHGFWNNLDPVSGPGGGGGYQHPGGYYPGYPDQDLSSFYKQHYGYDPAAVFSQKQDSESPSRGKLLRYLISIVSFSFKNVSLYSRLRLWLLYLNVDSSSRQKHR